ncbi:MAG TPA: hypothetical protein VHE61_13170 [Opitutaceae bacterium]|nr:hypothetical protein [Opitutaceae bacterium]
MRRVIPPTVAIIALIAVYLAWHAHQGSGAPANGTPTAADSKLENPNSKIRPAAQSALRNPDSAIPVSHLADDLNSPRGNIHQDLQIMSDVLAAYRSNFPHDGNPWGDNEEITAQLTGRNRLHLALVSRDLPAINHDGELCDRWGTPFFFHAESGTHMAIRSAGPDRKMWTADDIDLEP